MFAEQASQACIAVGFRIALRGVPAELSLGYIRSFSLAIKLNAGKRETATPRDWIS